MSCEQDEAEDIQDCLAFILPGISLETAVFHPTWVRQDGVVYRPNMPTLLQTKMDYILFSV